MLSPWSLQGVSNPFIADEGQIGPDPLEALGSQPFAHRHGGGSRTRNATGYESVPGTARIAAMSSDHKPKRAGVCRADDDSLRCMSQGDIVRGQPNCCVQYVPT